MNLTIIIPTLNNKEIIRAMKKNRDDYDQVIPLKVTSHNVLSVMKANIEDAQHNNILIINPRDSKVLKKNFIDGFRGSGTIVTNLNKNEKPTHGSSIKFNRHELILTNDVVFKNIFDFIQYIYKDCNQEMKKYDNTVKETVKMKEPVIKNSKDSPFTIKPKILFVCDVKGWAWWIKSHYIKKYLDDEFNIDIINVIDKGKKAIDKNKYDLYFTFGYSYVSFLRGVDFKKTITGVTAHRGKSIVSQLKRAHALHANSMLLLNEYKHANKNIFYVPNGVDHEMFYPRKESDILERDYINIGHVGKKAKMKQQDTVIEPVIKELGSKFKYIYHYNNYMDRIPHDKMPELYTDMDLFIVASLEDGTPNGALEAMASGVPVISNRIGNMPEIIKDGYNGYIVEKPSIANYVKLIQSLDKEHLIEMGKNARQSIENNWTWEHKAENYRYMFRKLLGK